MHSVRGAELNTAIQLQPTESVGLNINGGVTYTDPIDEGGREDLNGDDSLDLFVNAILWDVNWATVQKAVSRQDRPRFLKYRSRWMARAGAELSYNRWALQTNFRYTSRIENVDYIFLSVDLLEILGTLQIPQ